MSSHVRPKTVTESVLHRLRDEIRTGELAPGARLRQMDIARRYDVSSTPVREAFTSLEREGLVISSAHRGVVVFQPTLEDLRETYEIRIALELLAIERAVAHMTDHDLDEIEAILAEMGTLGSGEAEMIRYGELNRRYHARIYSVARMPKLERMILDLRDASAAYMALHRTLARSSADTQRDHTLIFEACRARDAARAREALGTHLRHTVDAVTRGLDGSTDREPLPVRQ